jgi:hypothetical protein
MPFFHIYLTKLLKMRLWLIFFCHKMLKYALKYTPHAQKMLFKSYVFQHRGFLRRGISLIKTTSQNGMVHMEITVFSISQVDGSHN